MKYEVDPLYQKIITFDIDGSPCALTFADRLARENSWSQTFADRVIVEYKRFVYLAKTAGHTVTPSVEVDEAWHLHLTYTESYWERMCKEVLHAPLHHGPTKGGASEQDKHVRLYEQTLETYQQMFNSPPPVDIWPKSEIRFAAQWQPKKIVPAHTIAIDRLRMRTRLSTNGIALVCFVFLSGCAALADEQDRFFVMVGAVILGAMLVPIFWYLIRFFFHDVTKMGNVDGAGEGAIAVGAVGPEADHLGAVVEAAAVVIELIASSFNRYDPSHE